MLHQSLFGISDMVWLAINTIVEIIIMFAMLYYVWVKLRMKK